MALDVKLDTDRAAENNNNMNLNMNNARVIHSQRKPQLLRKALPDHSNDSSPTRSPHDVAMPLTSSTTKLGPPPPFADETSVPSIPMDDISLPPPVDQVSRSSKPARVARAASSLKAWNTLRKSRSSSQIRALPRSLSPAAHNTPLPPPPPHSRIVSVPMRRPDSSHSGSESFDPFKKRRSWMPGSRPVSRHTSQDTTPHTGPVAWVATENSTLDYTVSLNYLKSGAKIPELWSDDAEVLVSLFPKAMGRGPSFKVPSLVLVSSPQLMSLMQGDRDPYDNEGVSPAPGSPEIGSTGDVHRSGTSNTSVTSAGDAREYNLYFPISATVADPDLSAQDIQALVDARNLFAFLTGQVLIATLGCPTIYQVFLRIADLLKKFEFSNFDGSSFGEAASASFRFYVDNLKLGDVRASREKTIEALILGEYMRSPYLYNEAYTHAVGKYSALKNMNASLFNEVSVVTRQRLERSHHDLTQRQASADLRLANFEIPSLFAGIATSTSSAEAKFVRFKQWKNEYFSMRREVLAYYKDTYGQWPPKPNKKNAFVEGGLNRLVLKGLYADLCDLYDLLVDREMLTTRGIDASHDQDNVNVDGTAAALRKLLAEFDRCYPPVLPPMPFDVPRVPSMDTIDPKFSTLGPKNKHKLMNRKLKPNERTLILVKSYNPIDDRIPIVQPFIQMYRAFEEREAAGKTCLELTDMRYGHWIFLYSTLQSLPLLAVDAPDLRYTEAVEYFLCQPAMGSPPWMEEREPARREWYGIAQSGGVVSLPADIVTHGVEGVYRRSHCWTAAEHWLSPTPGSPRPSFVSDQIPPLRPLSPLAPPPGFAGGELGTRPSARSGEARPRPPQIRTQSLNPDDRRSLSRHSQRSSIAFGLERLAVETRSPSAMSPISLSPVGSRRASPAGMTWDERDRRVSSYGSARPSTAKSDVTFDAILQGWNPEQGKESKEKAKDSKEKAKDGKEKAKDSKETAKVKKEKGKDNNKEAKGK